jgi:hyperosmotically inducible periplasmic protein
MKTSLPFTLAVIACSAMAGCSREDTSREAREAAAGVKTVAARAGDRLADSWLTVKVQAQFFADEDIKARYIDVSSRDGTVTLKGFVESNALRQEAVQIARTTEGVTHVEDQLLLGQTPQTATNGVPGSSPVVGTSGSTVTPPPGEASVPNDSMVTSLIQSKYFVDPGIKMRSIDVSTTNGVVTLRGKVASDNERAQALLMARTTEGVARVEDALAIDASLAPPTPAGAATAAGSPLPSTAIAGAGAAATGPAAPQASGPAAVGTSGTQPADASLETTIRSKLAGDSQLKAARLEVSARDGVVLLQGTVATQAVEQKALTLARESQGVVQVIDRIAVKK